MCKLLGYGQSVMASVRIAVVAAHTSLHVHSLASRLAWHSVDTGHSTLDASVSLFALSCFCPLSSAVSAAHHPTLDTIGIILSRGSDNDNTLTLVVLLALSLSGLS